MILSKPKPKTVDSAVSALTSVVNDLREIAEREDARHLELAAQANHAASESFRAKSIASKFDELLS